MGRSLKTPQEATWSGKFGNRYTDRNIMNPGELDENYKKKYYFTRGMINERLFYSVKKNNHILEVGCNAGNQLVFLDNSGFTNLYGIDINPYAISLAKKRVKNGKFFVGSVFNLPFEDDFFDMVFTSGLLIHISPSVVGKAIKEIGRVSNSCIGGLEYYSEGKPVEIVYHGYENLLWRNDFIRLFYDNLDNMYFVFTEFLCYKNNFGKQDIFYLIKKRKELK